MITAMTKRFGQGEWAVRAESRRLPAEFVPLARAFNAMAAQLAERERELIATNDRLTVIASVDMLSASPTGADPEPARLSKDQGPPYDSELSLLMIDVDRSSYSTNLQAIPKATPARPARRKRAPALPPKPWALPDAIGGEEFYLLLPKPPQAGRWRSARRYARRSRSRGASSPRPAIRRSQSAWA